MTRDGGFLDFDAAGGGRGPRWGFLALFALLVGTAAAQTAIPDGEVGYAPTVQRLSSIQAMAKRDGWTPHIAALRRAATTAYQQDKLQAAEAWYHAYRWAKLFGQLDTDFTTQWVAAVNAAHVAHRGMTQPTVRRQPLVTALPPELQSWMFANAAFSAEFFGLLAPVDYVPRVFDILAEIYRRDPARFRTFSSLALAIAVVYDVPPPAVWPHAQVTPAALPRIFPAAVDAFNWWIKQEQNGKLYHRISRLGAHELKFVVDTVAPFAELEWAQQAWSHGLAQLPNAYSAIRYRQDRVAINRPVWEDATYKLSDIFSQGGICSDQAYFATQVGKARGVPTLLFYGAGNDGRHAWFGYLDGNQKWQLDAGRYAEQRFVTGFARDPQTWREFTDHELQFLTEGFRELPAYRQSRVHANFAAEFLAEDNPRAAAQAARKAVSFERRNQSAWEVLLAAAEKEGKDARTRESLLREAALAFHQRYPDIEAAYINRVVASLRARGETSAADNEAQKLALKHRAVRSDLTVQQARTRVQRAIETQTLPEQIQVFNQVLDTLGRGAGIGFFDEVVVGFVQHLIALGHVNEAAKAVERARRTLKVEPKSQLATEFDRLAQIVKRPK